MKNFMIEIEAPGNERQSPSLLVHSPLGPQQTQSAREPHADMSSGFRTSTPADEAQIAALLQRVFAVTSDDPLVNPSLLRWKYWDPRPDYPGPRSYVMDCDGEIIAHAGVWPVRPRTGSAETGAHMIDWASDASVPGAGVGLLRLLTRQYDFIYGIGGSDVARSIFPRIGFRTVAQAITWTRPIRPWRQALRQTRRDFRAPLRLARNLWWAATPRRIVPAEWTLVKTSVSDVDRPCDQLSDREPAFFQYLAQCPAATCLTFDLFHRQRKAGFLALSVVGMQARMAGAWLDDPSVENWRSALLLAQEAARLYTSAVEFICRCASEASTLAAGAAGLRERSRAPVFAFRKDGTSTPLPIQFQMSDNDAVFL